MTLWNHLFGKKVVIEGENESGTLVRNVIDKSAFDEAIKNGKAVYGGKIKVHVLDPNRGYYIKEWEVGDDVEPADVAQFATPDREMYVVIAYEHGKPLEMMCQKDIWEKQREIADMIERGEDYEPKLRKHTEELERKIQEWAKGKNK
jgi:hypothetical protein